MRLDGISLVCARARATLLMRTGRPGALLQRVKERDGLSGFELRALGEVCESCKCASLHQENGVSSVRRWGN